MNHDQDDFADSFRERLTIVAPELLSFFVFDNTTQRQLGERQCPRSQSAASSRSWFIRVRSLALLREDDGPDG
jgi:hypothetical protein